MPINTGVFAILTKNILYESFLNQAFFLLFRGSVLGVPPAPCGLISIAWRTEGKKSKSPGEGLGLIGFFLRVKIFYFGVYGRANQSPLAPIDGSEEQPCYRLWL